jgi:hypothetical protein
MTSPEEFPGESEASLTAKLLDLRTFIGSLFIVFGVLVGGRGVLAYQEDIAKSIGINLNLWLGVSCLIFGIAMTAWTWISPPEILHHRDVGDDDLPEQMRGHGHH